MLIHIDIEAKAGPGLQGLLQAHHAALDDRVDAVLAGLEMLATAQEAMRETCMRMPERCDPYIYYSRVRPYIHGWKNSPALPNGLIMQEWLSMPGSRNSSAVRRGRKARIVPALDAGLGPMPRIH